MKILAFETSCDDTAVAVIEDGHIVKSNVRLTQTEHNDYGGVVPEIAARLHAENWQPTLRQALSDAHCEIQDIDLIACTKGPGLQTSLLTGTTVASFFSLIHQKTLIPVHHIYGHICANFLERSPANIVFPSLVLTVSGGHTQMHLWQSPTDIKILGSTLDDAAGEAFDKVAKMLGLGYPGGPIVSKRAEKGDRKAVDLPKIYLAKDSLDFSFSGLKASVYRYLAKTPKPFTDSLINDLCASFEFTVGKIFLQKVKRVIDRYPDIQQVHFVGGVSANRYLNQILSDFCISQNRTFFTPKNKAYSTDNAAMIGAAAYQMWLKDPKIASVQHLDANARYTLQEAFSGFSNKPV